MEEKSALHSDSVNAGFVIKTFKEKTVKVCNRIGNAANGNIFLVDYNNNKMMMIWMQAEKTTNYYQKIKTDIENGSPSDKWLWPVDVTGCEKGAFGYIMPLKSDGYYSFCDFLLGNLNFKSLKSVINAALNVVLSFLTINSEGLFINDFNEEMLLVNPNNGDIIFSFYENICAIGSKPNIIERFRYIAPEIVADKCNANMYSNLYQMSVILFILFCTTHPLEGKRSLEPCLSPALQEKLYGSEALFIMDTADRSNGPHPIVHKNVNIVWPCLPKYMQDLFLKAFSQKALTNPNARPKELEWIQNLVRFRSEIVQCSCGNEVFTQDGKPCVCEKCHKKINVPFRLEFCDYSIPGLPDSRIYRCQLGVCRADEALKPMGRVIAKKDTPGMLGVRNLSDKSWNAVTPSGKAKHVMPDEVIPLKDGISFVIGDGKINIKSN